MKGKLRICELEIPCRIGVSEHERANTQTVLVNIELEIELPSVDELCGTVDYAALANGVRVFCANRSWKLIETMAVDLADFVMSQSRALQVSVEVRKAALPCARFVSAAVTQKKHSCT